MNIKFILSFVFGVISLIVYLGTGVEPGESVEEKIKIEKNEEYYQLAQSLFLDMFKANISGVSNDKSVYIPNIEKEIEKRLGQKTKTIIYENGKPKSGFYIIFGFISCGFLFFGFLDLYLNSELRKSKIEYWKEKKKLAQKENQEALKEFKAFNKIIEDRL